MAAKGDYCAFAKAVEHLGDRWSLASRASNQPEIGGQHARADR